MHDNEVSPRKNEGRKESEGFSLVQIARAGVMLFGFFITLIGIILVWTLFQAVYEVVFVDAGGLKETFQQWREMIIAAGADPDKYDHSFPVTTAMAYGAMALPVMLLAWLATSVLTIGIKIAYLKDKK